jgi:hypothetical protein
MRYRVDLLLRAKVEDEALRELVMLANTYAIVETVEATVENGESSRLA